VNPGVGIHPFELDQRAMELDRFRGIELGCKGMMREQWSRG
jgi:hypothetical protein